jgi:hypothetical protein
MAFDVALNICNNSLHLVGHEGIVSMQEDSRVGKIARWYYPVAKAAVLRAHPWNSAIVREMVPQVNFDMMPPEEALLGFKFVYQLPPICLRVLSVDENVKSYNNIWWKVEGSRLYSMEPISYVKYIADIDDIKDPMLQEAITIKLASMLAFPITGNQQVAQYFMELYEIRKREAQTVDGQEGRSEVWQNSVLAQARNA